MNLCGYSLFQVKTGSMSGTIEVGDIVHIRDVLNEDYCYMFSDEMVQDTRETIESGIELLEILTHEQFEQNAYRLEEK